METEREEELVKLGGRWRIAFRGPASAYTAPGRPKEEGEVWSEPGTTAWLGRVGEEEAAFNPNYIAGLVDAAKPIAKFIRGTRVPDNLPITAGSPMARDQLTAGDFKALDAALRPFLTKDEING